MKYKIEYTETVKKNNEIIIEVDNEEQGDQIADEFDCVARNWDHPDDISHFLAHKGVKALNRIEGAEVAEYEIDGAGPVEFEED